MALNDDYYKSEWEIFYSYFTGEHFDNPKSISHWRRCQMFSLRRPNRTIKALERMMMEPCREEGEKLMESDSFLPKEERRFEDENMMDMHCRRQVHDICKKMFNEEFKEYVECSEAADILHPGISYFDFFRQQGKKRLCQEKFEADSKYKCSRIHNVYKPKFPESPINNSKTS